MKILEIKQITNEKFLNSFNVEWQLDDGRIFTYHLASRKTLEEVKSEIWERKKYTDAIRTIPYFYKDGEIYVVLMKEFRYIINDYIIGTPAGCLEKGETELEGLQRELNEEIGATIKSIAKSYEACYTTVGMVDESVACYFVEIEPEFGKQHLDATEQIEAFTVKFSDLPKYFNKILDFQTRYPLEVFYLEQENKRLKEELKNLKK